MLAFVTFLWTYRVSGGPFRKALDEQFGHHRILEPEMTANYFWRVSFYWMKGRCIGTTLVLFSWVGKKKKTVLLLCFFFTHTITAPTIFLTPDVCVLRGACFFHQTILCATSWVSYNFIQFWHYLPGDSIRFHRLRAQSHKNSSTPHFSCQSQVQVAIWTSNGQAIN